MRKPGEVVQINLRVRESLRRQLQAAAKKQGVPMNFELCRRLADSFEQRDVQDRYQLTAAMQRAWSRFGERFMRLDINDKLTVATDALVASVDELRDAFGTERQESALKRLQAAAEKVRSIRMQDAMTVADAERIRESVGE